MFASLLSLVELGHVALIIMYGKHGLQYVTHEIKYDHVALLTRYCFGALGNMYPTTQYI